MSNKQVADNLKEDEEALANAQLIANAPALLTACKSLLVIVDRLNRDTYDQTKLPPGSSSEWKEQVDARAAIAKAEGEPVYTTRQQGRDTITEQVSGRTVTDEEWEAHADQFIAKTLKVTTHADCPNCGDDSYYCHCPKPSPPG